MSWRYQHCGFSPRAAQGARFTGLEVAAIVGAAASVASIGMTIIGGAQQAEAQRQAGEAAFQNALIRKQHADATAARMENEATQRDNVANAQEGAAQRRAIEARRRGRITASRAQAVMAASGAGVDPTVLSSILAEGEYGFDTAIYEGEAAAQDTRYQAKLNRHEAATTRWAGEAGVAQGNYTRGVYNSRADATMTSSLLKAGVGALSLASKYAPDFGGGAPGTGATIGGLDEGGYAMTEWNRYDALGRRIDGPL